MRFWADSQIFWYVGFLTVVSVAMSVWLSWTQDTPWLDAIRLTTFNVVSVVTTTGYASVDYTLWGPMAVEETQYLRVYIGQLRQKLEVDPAQPRYLLTEPGVGYRLRMEDE